MFRRQSKKITILIFFLIFISMFSSLSSESSSQALASEAENTPRQMEKLNRGLVAVKVENGVFLSWRMLGVDSETIAFNLYRNGEKINSSPITESTNYHDTNGTGESTYYVRPVLNGKEQQKSDTVNVWNEEYLNVPIQKPKDGTTPDGVSYNYTANDASVGDVDGDGQYEIILKWSPSNQKDPGQDGYAGNVYLDAYELDGTNLWRINLGKNVRAGAHTTPFLVYDFDGDGKAEVSIRTADGTVDGNGKVIGDADADYRNKDGRIVTGPEYLTVFDGETGKELDTTDFEPARGDVCDWGDCYGNRADRLLAGVAYLDGENPSFVMARGYYEKTMLTAYNFKNGQIEQQWTFDSEDPGNEEYAGQGNHDLSVADVDGDGKDEIIYGSMTLDDDGTGMYSTGLGHGDAMHLSDLNPNRSGLEIFQVHESPSSRYGLEVHDSETGEILWGVNTGVDTGRGMAADIDPRYEGAEVWASQPRYGRPNAYTSGIYSITGAQITSDIPSSTNFGIWWDGDLLRELLDHTDWSGYDNGGHGVGTISKWDWKHDQTVRLLKAEGTYSNNGTKGNPSLQADLLGDWREEVVWRTEDSSALRIYTTTNLTEHRIYTLMHDPVYRLSVAWQNVGYNQPPHTSFYLGAGMEQPPIPNIYVTTNASDIKTLVNQLKEEEEIKSDDVAHSLSLHLTSVNLFEKQKAAGKVLKHMKGFNKLLDHQRKEELISKEAYNLLQTEADYLVKRWQ